MSSIPLTQQQNIPAPAATPNPPPSTSPASYIVYSVFICVLLSIAGWLGYQYYQLSKSEPLPVAIEEITSTPIPITPTRPSPSPIALRPGIGEYSISHPQTGGPRIDKVIFTPLDVKKGDLLHVSVVFTSASDITGVTGTLTGDTQVSDLVFSKEKTDKTSQTWTTELTLPGTVWYNYILTVTATNTSGKTTVQVAPRSS